MKSAVFTIIISLTVFLTACEKKQTEQHPNETSSPSTPRYNSEILIAEIATNGCLNLEKLMALMNRPEFTHNASIATTNFKTLSDVSQQRKQFHAYSAMDYKELPLNEIQLLSGVQQSDCKTLKMQSASHENIDFDITESSDKHLALKLKETFPEDMPDYKKKSLSNRLQPYKYTVTYNSGYSLSITTQYQSFDPICESKKAISFESTKIISWANDPDALPANFEIDKDFLENLKSALASADTPPEVSPTPTPVISLINLRTNDLITISTNTLSVPEIKKLTESPLREGLVQCTP